MNAAVPSLSIDATALSRYADVVFGYLDGIVPIRMLAETGTAAKRPRSEFPSVDLAAKVLVRLAPFAALQQRGLYVVPATVAIAGSAKAEDVVETGVLLIDIDTGDIASKRAHLERHLGTPSLTIASGGITSEGQEKLHLYWRLTEAAQGTDLETVRAMREAIAGKAGGDRSFGSLHQPIRVAGSIHGKNGEQRPVRILTDSGLEYELGALEESVAAMPVMSGVRFDVERGTGKQIGPTAAELATRVVRAGAVDEATRFQAMSKVIGHWLSNVRASRCSITEAREAVDNHNTAMISPPWDSDKLHREFEALIKRDVKAKGPMPVFAASTAPEEHVALSDDALAASFVEQYGPTWRNVATWGAWYGWSGTHWYRDETGLVRELVRRTCRIAARSAGTPAEARRVSSDKTIAAVLRIASYDPTVSTKSADWDRHAMLLNTPSGVFDLETGVCSSHNPSLLLTQVTAASPAGACPMWRKFLSEITDGSADAQDYLQRLAGYVLTGSTREQVFAFFHGPGGNGKSVFLQTLGTILGDYAATATLDTFMATSASRHLTELAGLRAARLVIVPETEAGATWAEARIKAVTGGEKIRANFMHRDHFEYLPQFKLIVAGNHRPSLSSVGEAMRRRLHLVPFDVTIAPEARDPELSAKLLSERDGILSWMLDGCACWQRMGLRPPSVVTRAAQDYFMDEDIIGQWLADRCMVGPGQSTAARDLFASWSAWADTTGHLKSNQKMLGEALRQRGFSNGKVGRDRGWYGLCLSRTASAGGDDQ